MPEKNNTEIMFRTVMNPAVFVRFVALVTLGSGLVNLYSVIGPGLEYRMRILLVIFPLEFLHFSRFLTLLIGFSLAFSSINIYRRKKRALLLVSILSFLSIIFHLTKALDYEEAIFSLVLLMMLFLTRKYFTVKSSFPDVRLEMTRLGFAVIIAFAYGVAGFWFLDLREFGVNFTIGDSIRKTMLFLSFHGDTCIHPHTHHARWFLDSLYLTSITAISYSLITLFRPVIYKYRTHPREGIQARNIVEKYGRSALDFFKYWPDKSYFFSSSQTCFIAFGMGGNYALALGDPVGPAEEIEDTIRGFKEFCSDNGWGLGFHQTLPDFLPVYQNLGFRKLKIGDEAIVDLTQFTLEGSDNKDFRNKIRKLEKTGIHIARYEPPLPESVLHEAQEDSEEWLQIPGRRERSFTLGQFEFHYIRSRPLFSAVDEGGKMLAFVNIIPSYHEGETTVDLMRHRIEIPNGIMDYLFLKNFQYCKEQGYRRFNLGLAPLSGFQETEDATLEERGIHYFVHRLNFLFSFTGLKQYKAKFATFWEPRYSIYQNPLDLPRLALALTRVSEIT